MITGGYEAKRSVEIIDILNNRSCQLDDLPDSRYKHTQVCYQPRDWPYWHYCYRMVTFSVVMGTLVWHGLMAPGLSVTIFFMVELDTQAGPQMMVYFSLVARKVTLLQRWSPGRGQLRRVSLWNIQASKNIDIECNVVMNNIFVVTLASLMRVRAFFWLEAGTVE